RPRRAKLLAHLGRKSADAGVVEVRIEPQIFVAPEGFDVERLAFEIARIQRVDLQLLAHTALRLLQLRPDRGELFEADRWVREKLQRVAALAILIDFEPTRF